MSHSVDPEDCPTFEAIIPHFRAFGQASAHDATAPTTSEQSYQALRQKLGWPERVTSQPGGRTRTTRTGIARRWTGASRWAVTGLGLVLLAAFGLAVSREQSSGLTPRTETSGQAFKAYTTGKGQQASVRLQDGTMVLLNVASRLLVPADYGVRTRALILEGEAQFTATHDPQKPLIVTAGGAIIRDLATVFGIRAYAGDAQTAVVVAEGKVDVSAKKVTAPRSAVLERGDLAIVTAAGTTELYRDVDMSNHLGWTQGELVFRDTPIAEALSMLERWYDVRFEISDSALAVRHVTGVIRGRQWTEEVLQGIAETVGATVERRGAVITFKTIEGQ